MLATRHTNSEHVIIYIIEYTLNFIYEFVDRPFIQTVPETKGHGSHYNLGGRGNWGTSVIR